jgi:hypothetical protein
VLDRVLAFGDGWLAQHRGNPLERVGELRSRAAGARRYTPVDVIGVPPDPAVRERYEATGVRRVSMWAPSGQRSAIQPALDAFERAVADVHGEWPPTRPAGASPPRGSRGWPRRTPRAARPIVFALARENVFSAVDHTVDDAPAAPVRRGRKPRRRAAR